VGDILDELCLERVQVLQISQGFFRALLGSLGFLQKLGIFQDGRGSRHDELHEFDFPPGKSARLVVLYTDHADDLIMGHQGCNQQPAHFGTVQVVGQPGDIVLHITEDESTLCHQGVLQERCLWQVNHVVDGGRVIRLAIFAHNDKLIALNQTGDDQ